MSGASKPLIEWSKRLLICAPLLLASCMTQCGDPTGRSGVPEKPVTAPAGPEVALEAGKDVSIRASAKGAERYVWELEGEGKLSATTGEAIIYSPPDHEGAARLSVTASNQSGDSPQTLLMLSILAKVSVQLDTLGLPSGWMSGGGQPEQFISLARNSNECQLPQPCLRVTYKPGGKWGGVVWWPRKCGSSGSPDDWAVVRDGACGVNVLQQGNFKSVERLAFLARGARGGERIEFKVGAADISPRPGKSLGRVPLKPEWEQYEIDLRGLDLSDAIGLFYWLAADDGNPQGATFYLANIRFEGVR